MKQILFRLSLLFLVLFSSSFTTSMFSKSVNERIPKDDKIALAIIDETAATLKRRHKLHPCGFGMGGMELFKTLDIQFQVIGTLSREKARVILLDCVEEFLKNINSNEEIKPLLINYPFSHENVSLTLFIRDKNNNKLYHPNISVVSFRRRGLEFITNDPDNEYKYKEEYLETYQEACQLVHRNE